MELLEVPQGSFRLDRHPPAGRRPLRAWDAADEYLLHHLADRGVPIDPARTLVVNDAAGALTVALTAAGGAAPQLLTDSHVSVLARQQNLARNGLDDHDAVVHAGPDALGERPDRPLELVLVKFPKSSGLLEDQLHRLRRVLGPDTTIVGAAMTRHLHTSTLEVVERILGPTRTSLARKKARLAHVQFDPDLDPGASPWPVRYQLPNGATVVDHAGVHAAGRLDPGTRFFVEHLPAVEPGATILDLGCGDGAVGLTAAMANPDTSVVCVDESHLAVASARTTFELAGVPGSFLVGDVLEHSPGRPLLEPGSVDVALVNPPFHDDHSIGDDTAWRMFSQARLALREGGRIVVIGNQHLAHHAKLARIFGSSEVVASNPKFVICSATSPGPPVERPR